MAKLLKNYRELMNILMVTGIFVIFASVMTGILTVILLEGRSRAAAYKMDNSLNFAAAPADSSKHASAAAPGSSVDINPLADEKPLSDEMTIPAQTDSPAPAAAAEVNSDNQATGDEAAIVDARESYPDNPTTVKSDTSSNNEKRDDADKAAGEEVKQAELAAPVTPSVPEVKPEEGAEKKQPNTEKPPSETEKLPGKKDTPLQENKPVVTEGKKTEPTVAPASNSIENNKNDKDSTVTVSGTNSSSPAKPQPGT